MGKLIYSFLVSLDGYVTDQQGNFDWAMPDEEVHAFINDLQRPIGTYLYGRRLYETMSGWETDPSLAAQSEVMRDFAHQWQAAEKIVFSTSLPTVSTTRSRIERRFSSDVLRELKADAGHDLCVGGPTLAAYAIRAGLVDEYQLVVAPVATGGGTPFFPNETRVDLTLQEEHRFGNGMVYLRYLTAT